MIGIYTDRWPSTRTMLYWSWLASSALPMSDMVTQDLPAVLIGSLFSSRMSVTMLFE